VLQEFVRLPKKRLQNRVLPTIGNFPRRTLVRDLYMVFKIPYIKIMQATSIIMKMFAILDKAKPDIGSIKGLNLAAVMHTTVQVTRLPF
jgi:hypothetical protein